MEASEQVLGALSLKQGPRQHTAISKSTNFSANVDISLLKQNRYSPML